MTFFIKLPDDLTVENEIELLDFVFGGIKNNNRDSAWLRWKKMNISTQLSFLTHCAPQECGHTHYS